MQLTSVQSASDFDTIYHAHLKAAVQELRAKQKWVVVAAIITRILELYFIILIVSLFLGFMQMFPFEDLPGGSISGIFSGFMYGVLGLVVLMIVNRQVKIKLGERNIQAVKKNGLVNGLTVFISAVVLVSAYFIGTRFLGDDFGTAFFIKWTAGIFSVFVLMLPFRLIKNTEDRFSERYQDVFMQQLLPALWPEGKYEKEKCLRKEEFNASGLFASEEIFSYDGSGLFTGNAHQFHGSFLNVKQIERSTSKGRSETKISDLFKGYLFVADFNKPFHNEIYVLPDISRSLMGEVYAEFLNSMIHSKEKKLVLMEDPVFEKVFSVYAGDAVEARFILSTKLIERINELKAFFYQDIFISFNHQKIYIAVKTDKQLFTPNIFGRLDDQVYLQKQYQYLVSLLSIPRQFDLDNRIWSPELK